MLVSRLALADSLEKAKRAIATKSSMSALNMFLVRIGKCLEVHGSDLDWGVTVFGEEMEGEEHSFLAPLLFLDVVKSLNSETIDLVPDLDVCSLTIKSTSGKTVLNVFPADDYPQFPKMVVGDKSFTLTAEQLKSIVDFAGSCAVKNPARPLWGAICATVKDNNLEMVSTDQFSLSISDCSVESEDLEFITSAEVLRNITRLMEGDVKVTVGENMAFFECSTAKCYTRLLEGTYYPYHQAIPSHFVTTVETERSALLNAVNRGSIVASEENRALALTIGDSLNLSAQSEKGRMEEIVEATIVGDPIELWIQHSYLSNALRRLDGKVKLSFSGAIKPLRVSDSGSGFCIIMPMTKPEGV